MERSYNTKMAKRKKNKVKTKKIYVKQKEEDHSKKVEEEIKELEERKKNLGPGWRNKLRGFAINKEINNRRAYLNQGSTLRNVKRATEVAKSQVELEKAKVELNELKKKRQVNFGGLEMGSKKNITFDDLYQ